MRLPKNRTKFDNFPVLLDHHVQLFIACCNLQWRKIWTWGMFVNCNQS